MSAISVEDVSKNWGAARAVDRVSFAAAAGSLLVLLGPSGCGKSTTLRLVAGLEAVDEGRIVIGGRDVTARPPAERGIAMLDAVSPELRAFEYGEYVAGPFASQRVACATVAIRWPRPDLDTRVRASRTSGSRTSRCFSLLGRYRSLDRARWI